MRLASLSIPIAFVCAALAAPGTVRADGARIVSGGPAGKAAKRKVEASFERLRKRLAVCWCETKSAPVRVALTVSARGKVLSAKQKRQNAHAQCAAGVLAVNALAGTGSKYSMVVELDPAAFAAGSSGGLAGDVMDQIKEELKPYRAKLQSCYDRVAVKEPDLAGAVQLGFLIRADGRIVDPEVKSSTLGHAGVEKCLLDTLLAARVGERPGGKTISFSLALNFQGGAQSPGIGGDASLRPQKDGPVSAAALSKVMNENKNRFSACYDKVARKKRDLKGHVVLRFTIRDDGTVRNVKIRETTLENKQVESCIVKVGESLRFPGEKGRAKTRVFYPFVFEQAK